MSNTKKKRKRDSSISDDNEDIKCQRLDIEIPQTKHEIERYDREVEKLISKGILPTVFEEETKQIESPEQSDSESSPPPLEAPQRFSSLSSLRAPPPNRHTVILTINTHGMILCSEDTKYDNVYIPETTTVPTNMEIHKINISAPGVAAIAEVSSADYYMNIIFEFTKKFLEDDSQIIKEKHVPDILEKFKITHGMLLEFSKKEKEKDIDYYDFSHYSQKGYNYFFINQGNEIVNKMFIKKVEEVEETKSKYDFRICEIKFPFQSLLPDLLELSSFSEYRLEYNENSRISTTMDQLIDYYNKQGITRLIIFDFSCSMYFLKERRFLKGREANHIRRNMCKSKIAYGGKNNGRKRSNKSNNNRCKLKTRTRKRKNKTKRKRLLL
jgi:hypothetical protein